MTSQEKPTSVLKFISNKALKSVYLTDQIIGKMNLQDYELIGSFPSVGDRYFSFLQLKAYLDDV